jgi:nicotinate-nucleotide pyrophosphorylase (carboxylating)
MTEAERTDARELIRRALAEDVGPGDLTTMACVPAEQRACGWFLARQELVLAGVELLPLVYEMGGGVEALEIRKRDGERAAAGDIVAEVRGPARTLLTCERVALNFLQRLSGVATMAARFVDAVRGTPARILDTRKTTPGLRLLEKRAAAAGGVRNHRIGLFDAILIKNNHIAAAGGVRAAVGRALAFRAQGACPPDTVVEVEVRTPAEADEALAAGATNLLLDNFTPAGAAELIRHLAGRARVEISGGITLANVRAYAEAGPDFISAGAITHSAPAVDLSFRLEWE